MLRGLIAALVMTCAVGEAHAQQQMTKGVKAVLQTAATVCVEWVSGRANFTKTPPPGFRAATVLERIGFNFGVGEYGDQVTAVWLSKPGGVVERAVVEIDGGCVAYSSTELSPVDADVMKTSFEAMMRRIDPDAPELEYDWTGEEDGMRTVYYTLDENPDMMVGIGQGWRSGSAARGSVYVIVKAW
jgi:hypothetical protein